VLPFGLFALVVYCCVCSCYSRLLDLHYVVLVWRFYTRTLVHVWLRFRWLPLVVLFTHLRLRSRFAVWLRFAVGYALRVTGYAVGLVALRCAVVVDRCVLPRFGCVTVGWLRFSFNTRYVPTRYAIFCLRFVAFHLRC